jgi:hypothetical protein
MDFYNNYEKFGISLVSALSMRRGGNRTSCHEVGSKMASSSTLNSLLAVQFNLQQKCFEFKPNKDLIKRCKNAISEIKEPTN